MDQLDENLRELKRRVDTRMEQMLILRRAQAGEPDLVDTRIGGSSEKHPAHEETELDHDDRPALPLPQGVDPTVIGANESAGLHEVRPKSAVGARESSSKTGPSIESAADELNVGIAGAYSDHDSVPATLNEGLLAHAPAIRRRGLLHRLFGKLLSRRN